MENREEATEGLPQQFAQQCSLRPQNREPSTGLPDRRDLNLRNPVGEGASSMGEAMDTLPVETPKRKNKGKRWKRFDQEAFDEAFRKNEAKDNLRSLSMIKKSSKGEQYKNLRQHPHLYGRTHEYPSFPKPVKATQDNDGSGPSSEISQSQNCQDEENVDDKEEQGVLIEDILRDNLIYPL